MTRALRSLARAPGFTLVAVLTLALGIGLTTSMFSFVNLLLLRPLPYPDADRLLRVFGTTPQNPGTLFSATYVAKLREQNSVFAQMGVFAWWGVTLSEPGRPAEFFWSFRVSPDFLPTIGVAPALGRNFTAAEDTADNNVAILTHFTWTTFFNRDPDIVGRVVRFDAQAVEIVGVLPEHFDAPLLYGPVRVLRPLGLTAGERANREERFLNVVGRLQPDLSLAQARAGLDTIATRIGQDEPPEHREDGIRALPLHASGNDAGQPMVHWLVLGLAGFVLLIACANLANLQLVRATARVREYAIRAALGASRFRLMRPLLAESLALVVLGGGLGVLIALGCNEWIGRRTLFAGGVRVPLPLDGRVLAFAVGASLLAGVLFGVVPGLLAARARVADALRSGSRGSTASRGQNRVRHILVAAQFALALTLLAGAGFFFGGIERFLHRDPGWRADNLMFGYVAPPHRTYPDRSPRTYAFYEQLKQRLADLPGVSSATISWQLPLQIYPSGRQIEVEGRDPAGTRAPLALFNGVMPGYFDALGIRLREGRDFTRHDNPEGPGVVIINEALARALFPGESAVGQRLGGIDPAVREWWEIVGVAADVEFAANTAGPPTRFQAYRPLAQEPWNYVAVAVRATAAPAQFIEPLRRLVSELDPDIPVSNATPVDVFIAENLANFSLLARLLSGFALLGLFLAALGIYGVLAQVVVQRTPELGLRVAVGAQARDIRWLVLGSGLRLSLVGMGAGLVGATIVDATLARAIPELPAPTWTVLALVTLSLVTTALLACWLPARRATRVDPLTALRAE